MSRDGHVMFAECFRDICAEELMAEYTRVLPLPPSNWRMAVMNEVEGRRIAALNGDDIENDRPSGDVGK